MLMIFTLLSYHIKLLGSAMTTNEHMGIMKYKYLRNEMGAIDTPFSKHSLFKNWVEGLFPPKKSFFSRREVEDYYQVQTPFDKQSLLDSRV